MRRRLAILGVGGCLLCSTASAMPGRDLTPRLSLSPALPRWPDVLSGGVAPSVGGSANPMNLAAWATLAGVVIGGAGAVAFALDAPVAVSALVIGLGASLFLVGPSLSYGSTAR